MSKISDKLRELASECEAIEPLTGIIFAMSGDLEIRLACADSRSDPLETMRGLAAAAQNAVTYGTMKPASPADLAKLEAILNS